MIEAQERKQNEKRDVWVCVVSEGTVALALTAVAISHRKGVLKSYRSLKVQGSRFFIIHHIHNHTSIISSEMQVELKKNTAFT